MASKLLSKALLVTLIALIAIPTNLLNRVDTASAVATTTVASIYLDAPFVQGSYARHYGGVTELFNNSGTSSTTISSNTASIVGGTKTSGSYTRFDNSFSQNVYGAQNNTETATVGGGVSNNTGFANTDSTGFEITFSTAVKYIGFWWAAGNTGNTVTLYSGSTTVASFDTTGIRNILGNVPASDSAYASATDSITATNGSIYRKKYYFGSPAGYTSTTPTVRNSLGLYDEPFAFVHAFAQNGQSFDRIKLSGAGFEFDNLTVSTQDVPIRDSLYLATTATTTAILGESAWTFKGITSSDSSTVSANWKSESMTATSNSNISVKLVLSIETGSVTVGTTALFQAPLNDTSTVTCGTYSRVTTFTPTNNSYDDLTIVNSGSASRNQLVRGFCYAWTQNPSSTFGSGAVRPTGSASGSLFNSNLDSPVLYIPKLPDVKIPSTIPIIPSNQSVNFPATKINQGSGQVQVCLFENDGSTINGAWGTVATNQNLQFTSSSTSSNPYIGNSSTNALNLFNNLRITRTNNSKFSVDRYVLIRIAPYLGTAFTTNCEGSGSGSSVTYSSNLWPNSQNVYLVRLKSINLKRTHSFVISPRNGRDN